MSQTASAANAADANTTKDKFIVTVTVWYTCPRRSS